MRTRFVDTVTELLDQEPTTTLVLADISADLFTEQAQRHPDQVLNVGIRESLMISVGGGLALTGLRPIIHTYAPFLIERSYEQIKLDLTHQGMAAVLVSVGASYDWTEGGRTHQSPGDVALRDSLPGWTVHVPGHPDEVAPLLRTAVHSDDPVYLRLSNRTTTTPRPAALNGQLDVVRPGRHALVLAVGPMLDPVLAATTGLDVTVAYTNTIRPLDLDGPARPGRSRHRDPGGTIPSRHLDPTDQRSTVRPSTPDPRAGRRPSRTPPLRHTRTTRRATRTGHRRTTPLHLRVPDTHERTSTMSVELNHTVIWARDKAKSAAFLAGILDVPVGEQFGPFVPVQVSNGVTLDYADTDAENIQSQHYAFLLDEDEFDAAFTRIQECDLTYYADPYHRHSGEINHNYGGRGVYFNDPDGHKMELMTTPYSAIPAH